MVVAAGVECFGDILDFDVDGFCDSLVVRPIDFPSIFPSRDNNAKSSSLGCCEFYEFALYQHRPF